MKKASQRSGLTAWIGFAGSIVLAAFLVWFGIRILGSDAVVSSTDFFLLGCVAGFGGVFVLGTQVGAGGRISGGGILLLSSLYFFARAGGIIEGAWLTKISGIACFLAAVLLLYVMFPSDRWAQPPSEDL